MCVDVCTHFIHSSLSTTDSCMCSSADMGSSLQLCSGAAISPCDCIDTVCNVRDFLLLKAKKVSFISHSLMEHL